MPFLSTIPTHKPTPDFSALDLQIGLSMKSGTKKTGQVFPHWLHVHFLTRDTGGCECMIGRLRCV